MNDIKRIIKIIDKYKLLFAVIVALVLLANVSMILYVNQIKIVVNHVIELEKDQLLKSFILVFIIFIARLVLNKLTTVTKKSLYSKILNKLREHFFHKLTSIPLYKLEAFLKGDMATRFINDLPTIARFFSDVLINNFYSLIMLVVITGYIAMNNIMLSVVLLLIPIQYFFTKKLGKKVDFYSRIYHERLSKLNASVKDIVDFSTDIQLHDAKSFFMKRHVEIEESMMKNEKKRITYAYLLWGMSILAYNITYILFFTIGGVLAYYDRIDFGIIVALFLLIDNFVELISSLPSLFSTFYENKAVFQRVVEVFDLQEKEKRDLTNYPSENKKDLVSIDNMSYSYSEDTSVLQDIKLNINYGERILVVGESGCGKSTLLKLMAGYDNRYSGSIKVNGVDVKECSEEYLLSKMTYLPQQVFTTANTIKEWLSLFKDNLEMKDLETYSKMACINDDILAMKDSYDTFLGNDGENVSIGQKQRLGIMLALMKKAPMYLMDESFSSIELSMAMEIMDNLKQIPGTIVVVSHNMQKEFMDQFDRIVVMDKGRIIGVGNREELLANNSTFKELYNKSTSQISLSC